MIDTSAIDQKLTDLNSQLTKAQTDVDNDPYIQSMLTSQKLQNIVADLKSQIQDLSDKKDQLVSLDDQITSLNTEITTKVSAQMNAVTP